MEMLILSTPGCAHCASAKKAAEAIKTDYPDLQIKEIDLIDEPEYAMQYSVMTAPGIVINGKLEFTGGVTENQLRKKLDEVRS